MVMVVGVDEELDAEAVVDGTVAVERVETVVSGSQAAMSAVVVATSVVVVAVVGATVRAEDAELEEEEEAETTVRACANNLVKGFVSTACVGK